MPFEFNLMSSHERRMYVRIDKRAVVTTFTIDYSDARDSLVSALVDDLATNPLALRYFYAFTLLHRALDDVDQVKKVISASMCDEPIDDAAMSEVVAHCVVATSKLVSVLKPATAQMLKDFGQEVSVAASLSDMLSLMDNVYLAALERGNQLIYDRDEFRLFRLD